MTPEQGRSRYKHWDEYDIKPGDDSTGTSLTRIIYEWPQLYEHWDTVMCRNTGGRESSDWTGDGDIGDLLKNGDRDGVEAAEKLLQEINTQIDVEDLGTVMGLSPMGASVSIGHYLAGQPACMRRLIEAESDHCPIRVYIGLACSAANSVEVQQKRGIACVALAMALSRIRPVELWGFCAARPEGSSVSRVHGQHGIDVCIQVKIGMSPFDMSVVSALLSKLVLTRSLMYAMCSQYGGDANDRYLSWCQHADKACVEASPTDVVVPQLRSTEASKVWKDPVGWVQEELEKALKNQGEAMRLGMGTATEYANDHSSRS